MAFDLAVHVGTLLAVVLYFYRDVLGLTLDGWNSLIQRRCVGQGRIAGFLVIGTILAALAETTISGASRSGATITAGLLLGLNREPASRFSFLLAIPITALATSAKLLEVATADIVVVWTAFLIGGVTSFVTALTAIHLFLKWLNRFGMWPYVIYRLLLAAVIYFIIDEMRN